VSRRRISRAVVAISLLAFEPGVARAVDGDPGEAAPSPSERAASPSAPGDSILHYLFEIGGRIGYTTVPIRGGVNPFGLGFGARLGYGFRGFYFGVSAMDFQGGSDVGATDQAWLFGGELGYGFRIGPYVTIRPLLGFGDTLLTHNEPSSSKVDVVSTASGGGSGGGGSVTTSVNNVYLQPALVLMLASTHYFFAADVNSLVVPGITYGPPPAQQTTWLSYSVEGQLGFRL
jgi:hypothetical protein